MLMILQLLLTKLVFKRAMLCIINIGVVCMMLLLTMVVLLLLIMVAELTLIQCRERINSFRNISE